MSQIPRFKLHQAKETAKAETSFESGWERRVGEALTGCNILFAMKPTFELVEGIVYTPDFILSAHYRILGKAIVLEPHYFISESDAHKFSLFRKYYGDRYYLLLITKNDSIPYYRTLGFLPEDAYDDVWPIEYVTLLARQLKHATYRPTLSVLGG